MENYSQSSKLTLFTFQLSILNSLKFYSLKLIKLKQVNFQFSIFNFQLYKMEKREYTQPIMRLYNIRHREHLLQTASLEQNKLKIFDNEDDTIDDEYGVM